MEIWLITLQRTYMNNTLFLQTTYSDLHQQFLDSTWNKQYQDTTGHHIDASTESVEALDSGYDALSIDCSGSLQIW